MAMTSAELCWDDIEEGMEVPSLVKRPSAMQLFMFSAATWNRHLIHYNAEYALRDGLKNVAVHRALIGGFLAQMLTEWVGQAGRIRSIDWSVRGSAALDEPLVVRGIVVGRRTESGARLIECEVWAENHEGAKIAPGSATVVLEQ
jgi:hydroxyacyl-ACP dehydratase HTD2-like protein with hotdog domain